MNSEWLSISVNLAILAALVCSLWLNLRFIASRRANRAASGQVPPCPLTVGDLLIFAALTAATLTVRSPLLLALMVTAGAALLYRRRDALGYWRFKLSETGAYLRDGLRGYLTVLLPLTLIVLPVSLLCERLGVDFTQPVIGLFLDLHSPLKITLFILTAVIVAPLWEEIVFRGVLYPWLKKYLPARWAMLLSSSAWAASHLHWPALLPFTFLGCALCFFYEQTGRLGVTVALHAIFNLTTVLLLLLLNHHGNWPPPY
ncbi:MAG: CPBP family intramembrane metalloprotease [Verrucomicrobiales bacterium]|jgi:membrane protease YdiL (CAAX protease family)|nr:CPBP family intramembrane metalloprotease [Verrucomicrobiales bacterium]